MDDIIVRVLEKIKPVSPILIEGLPGVGNVGKLAAEHLIDETKAKKVIEIYSAHFPPQVLVDDAGLIKLVNNEIYHVERKDGDLLILVGDYQGTSAEGQYMLSHKIIEIARDFGVKMIFTLGGYGVGRLVSEPRVLGAATSPELVKKM
ncbi:MAG: proteasome assembly chaperone family protein, partial [Thermoplasmata archaeon]